jgi:hypothetical protein
VVAAVAAAVVAAVVAAAAAVTMHTRCTVMHGGVRGGTFAPVSWARSRRSIAQPLH